jgi:hypothetical protein
MAGSWLHDWGDRVQRAARPGPWRVLAGVTLTDTGYKPVNTNPALLASVGGASGETGQSALPGELAPGDVVYAAALFAVTSPAGLFCLEPSNGLGEHLPCTTLSAVRVPWL